MRTSTATSDSAAAVATTPAPTAAPGTEPAPLQMRAAVAKSDVARKGSATVLARKRLLSRTRPQPSVETRGLAMS